MEIKRNNLSPHFGYGLTPKLRNEINHLDVKQVAQQFKQMGVDTNFKNSKTIAGISLRVAEIMDEISKKYNLPFDTLPKGIEVKNPFSLFGQSGATSVDRTLFFRTPIFDSPVLLDSITDLDYSLRHSSSPHFISRVMHEWFHNIHLAELFKKFPDEFEMDVIEKINKTHISFKDARYADNKFGNYCMQDNKLFEFFAEAMTQFTTKSLDKDLKVVKNPMDNMPKDMPQFFKDFIVETLGI